MSRRKCARLIALLVLVTFPLAVSKIRGAVGMPRTVDPISSGPSLAERLGFSATDRLLIVNADDAGLCGSANKAVEAGLEGGTMTSCSIMVPAPGYAEIASYARNHPELDYGVHLTHNCEWTSIRWGPIAPGEEVPGLTDPGGGLWPEIHEVYLHSSPREAEIEGRAQIRKALADGIDVTHIDSHMGTLQVIYPYLEVYMRLAREFDLPLRMASQDLLRMAGMGEARSALASDGILCPDHFVFEGRRAGESVEDFWLRILGAIGPGVTELYIHPSLEAEDIKGITHAWRDRVAEFKLFHEDSRIPDLLRKRNIRLIGYRALRELQRKGRKRR